MEKKRLLVTGNPVPEDWEFRRGVEAATGQAWDVRVSVINRYDGLHKYTRYLTYFLAPLRLFFIRNRYEKIIYWEQFLGLMLAFYCRLFHVRTCPALTIMALIYKPKKGLPGRIFAWFVQYAVTSDYVKQIIVYSRSEVDYYSGLFRVAKDKFRWEQLGIADDAGAVSGAEDVPRGKYYIAAGRSNRDYAFLRAAWPKEQGTVYVVCDVERSEDTEQIKYEKDCHGDAYLRLLSGAYASIVPLESEEFSSGQLVFLQSAMLGIPVIATRNHTVSDYILEGETGLIIEKSPEALRRALDTLDRQEVRQRMGTAARTHFERAFRLYELGKRVGEAACAGAAGEEEQG